MNQLGYLLERLVIRSGRIAIGAGLALAGWIIFDSGDISGTPFSELTLSAVGGAIFRVWAGVALAYAAWFTAFGEAPEQKSQAS